jgi:catechol 2,3-dioxygenase
MMSLNTRADEKNAHTIHPETRLGPVELTVNDLERQVSFHQDVLGMKLHWQQDHRAGLGAGIEDILRLVERKDAVRARRTTGLYHTAIWLPSKRDLAQLLARIYERRSPLQGMSDHGTHLAIYLPDAEGNGIELAWDRPKALWPDLAAIVKDGDPAGMRRLSAALDVADLLAELPDDRRNGWEGMPAGTRVGHVHLHVADLQASRDFYHGLLGFDVILESDTFGIVFFSAGDYHHHIGVNIWNGRGAPPAPANASGLRNFSIVLPDHGHLEDLAERIRATGRHIEPSEGSYLLHDPAGNGIRITFFS